ncbi:hypothetical protein AALO_G00162210 [Alosa alosa]|uniref:Uncharacterized protein n=1 Tax=Alosa alosa TaxID=278164 RepID=A0AAV6GFD8_9TELE|nr:hypothetical protein AALO_G00162210 [Alosa alosa]
MASYPTGDVDTALTPCFCASGLLGLACEVCPLIVSGAFSLHSPNTHTHTRTHRQLLADLHNGTESLESHGHSMLHAKHNNTAWPCKVLEKPFVLCQKESILWCLNGILNSAQLCWCNCVKVCGSVMKNQAFKMSFPFLFCALDCGRFRK